MKENTKAEQQVFYLEGELTSAEKMYVMNEVTLRMTTELAISETDTEQKEDYEYKRTEATKAKAGLESKIRNLRALIAELKDGKFTV
jgi:hypothetical protein